jgi:transcriptional regulator with XRE-family HTH domain
VKNVVKNNYLVNVGSRIREFRKAKNLSMESLAAELEIDYRQLGRIERGEINTTILSLKRISDVLRIPIGDFLD